MKTKFIKTCMNSCKTIDDFRDADLYILLDLKSLV